LKPPSEAQLVLTCAVALTVFRSVTPVIEQHLNSDEALLGLMAKHLVEGRAFPLHLYSLPHMLGVTSWIAAPFFVLGGPTVVMLKLPLVLMNAAITGLLVDRLHRDVHLRPVLSLVASLPFILAPPFLSHLHYVDAGGGNPEPLLFVLLLWLLRDRPLWFGITLGVGVLNRPFVAYGALALLAVQCWDRSIRQPAVWRGWLISVIGTIAVWDLANSLRAWSSPRGPGTSLDPALLDPIAANAGFVCFDPAGIASGTWTFVSDVLPVMLGWSSETPLFPFAVGIAIAVGGARLLWLARSTTTINRTALGFALYLTIVGLLAAEVYVAARCGVVDTGTMRYALLTPFAFIGVIALVLALEPSAIVRRLIVILVCVWAAFQLVEHTKLFARAVTYGPTNPRRQLAEYLVTNNIRYASAEYWDAQALNFLTQERVVIKSEGVQRIPRYQAEVEAHAREAVLIRRQPCPAGGTEAVHNVYWICPSP
jgi:hypothetical protein